MAASRLYLYLIRTAEPLVPKKLLPLWNHDAGPKTIFFWAPTVKWSLVIAGLADVARPADKLSFNQSFTLACTAYYSFKELFGRDIRWSLYQDHVTIELTQKQKHENWKLNIHHDAAQ